MISLTPLAGGAAPTFTGTYMFGGSCPPFLALIKPMQPASEIQPTLKDRHIIVEITMARMRSNHKHWEYRRCKIGGVLLKETSLYIQSHKYAD